MQQVWTTIATKSEETNSRDGSDGTHESRYSYENWNDSSLDLGLNLDASFDFESYNEWKEQEA